MHIRPRCREWLPLATQQLRLRNLVRIHGLNIECVDRNSLIYYTLHKTADEIEFYKSEPLPARQQQQKWAEISSAEMLKSNLNCVCVKVWEQWTATSDDLFLESSEKTNHHTNEKAEHLLVGDNLDEKKSAFSKMQSYPNSAPRPPDKLLFMWGVYFSGLTLMNQSIESKFQSNSLIFQINGDFFTSPASFPLDSLMAQIAFSYKRFAANIPQLEETPVPDEFLINSPKVSPSSSPVTFADWDPQRERYIELQCNLFEVRRSYDLEKLLKIQELQRRCQQNSKDVLEITTEIQQQCARCITAEQLKRKKRTTSTSAAAQNYYQRHSMGRALSLLLSEQQERDPQMLLHTQKLQKQIESLQCKRQLLQTEYDTYSMRLSKLRQNLAACKESRQKLQESLHQRQHQLQSDKQLLEESNQNMNTESERKHQVVQNVERRMSSLCMELQEIYPILSNYKGFFTVCRIPFPNMGEYLNDGRYAIAQDSDMTPMALSASLGYVAHLVQMISVIINRPLRNPIHYEGSRTRIEDVVKDIPYASREFPLYSRSTIPSKPVKYAIHLLNQNIAQLCFDITGRRRDLRSTIENILHIFSKLEEIERSLSRAAIQTNSRSEGINLLTLHSSTTSQGNADFLSKSHSSVDLNDVPVPKFSPHVSLPSSIPMPIADRGTSQQRISRSVGSYSDCEDDFKNIIDHCYSNSDSNITTTNQSFAN